MIICLVLLGLANILGAMATSFPLLFATRILADIGSGGVFPLTAAAVMVVLGIVCARLLRQTRPADARPS